MRKPGIYRLHDQLGSTWPFADIRFDRQAAPAFYVRVWRFGLMYWRSEPLYRKLKFVFYRRKWVPVKQARAKTNSAAQM